MGNFIRGLIMNFQELLQSLLNRPQREPQGATPKAVSKATPTASTNEADFKQLLNDVLRQKTVPDRSTDPLSSPFYNFVGKTLDHEGGFTIDQGGETMRGITWRDNKDLLKRKGYTKDNLKDLKKEDAIDIYKQRYYVEPKLDKLPEPLQYFAFDFGVNSGPQRAIKELQAVVGASPDGRIGPETLKRVNEYANKYGFKNLAEEYVQRRKNFLKDLVKQNPTKHGQSFRGWMNRIKRLNQEIQNV